ncbi:MAG: hypothetical protein ACQCXQ_12315, partial [Verrucomicrobiales bacterium]
VLPFALFAVVRSVPNMGLLALMIGCCGVALAGGFLMTWTRLPLYRRGDWLSAGCKGLDEKKTRSDRIGFRLAACGLITGALLLLVLWMPGRPR